MKTIFKSLLYFSFAGLILTGCAKNDDFSVPPINCDEPNITATQTIDGLYNSLTENSKEVVLYPKDEIISGIVISSDQAGNFYQQLYIVDEKTQTPVTLKVDVKGGFALYPVGSKVFMKLKDTYIHYSYGMITIGGGIYTSSGGNKYADVITGSKLRTSLFRSCDVITGDNFKKYINEVTLDQFATDKKLFGKLVRIKDVQFERNVVGKTYFDANDVDGGGQTLRKMVDKKGNALQVRTGKYANGIKDQIITDRSGTVTGIMSDYQGTLQFAPRTMDDMALDQDPFEGETEEPGIQEELKFVGTHIFKGADFEDWNLFTAITSQFPLPDYVKPVADNYKGVAGKQSLHINGNIDKNAPIFTMADVPGHKGATKLSFIMKGASQKTISIEIIKKDGKTEAYNVINFTDPKVNAYGSPATTLSKSLTIEKASEKMTNGNGSNSYVAKGIKAVDTKGTWVKVTLNIAGVEYNDTGKGDFMRVRMGNNELYDLKLDELRFEDGTPGDGGTTDPEVPGGDKMNILGKEGTFKDLITTAEQGIKVTEVKGNAIKIEGTSTNNGAGFSIGDIAVPANAKNIVFYVTGESTPGGKDNDRGTFVVNTHDAAKLILANYSIKNSLANGKSGEIIVPGVNDNKNDYVGSIKTNGKVKVILPLKDISLNNTGIGGFLQFRFAKDGKFSLTIDNITFE